MHYPLLTHSRGYWEQGHLRELFLEPYARNQESQEVGRRGIAPVLTPTRWVTLGQLLPLSGLSLLICQMDKCHGAVKSPREA